MVIDSTYCYTARRLQEQADQVEVTVALLLNAAAAMELGIRVGIKP